MAKFLNIALGLIFVLGISGCNKSQEQPPNLILVTFDTTRADHLSSYGYRKIQTPHTDQIAREGTLFETTIAQVPLTAPSMASMLTSTYPFVNGVRTTGFESLSLSSKTLAEILKENGYTTAAIIGSFSLDHIFNFDQGFDYYDDKFTRSLTGNKNIKKETGPPTLSNWGEGIKFLNQRANNDAERTATEVTRSALKWLDQRPDGPFFLWVHYFDPHMPHWPPKSFRDIIKQKKSSYKNNFSLTYDAEILYLDFEFGKLINGFKKFDLLDKSLLVLHADHGEEVGLHGPVGHGVNVYEATIKVPLIFRGSGWPAKHRVSQQVRLLDVTPTILETLGIPPEPTHQGKSLYSLRKPKTNIPLEPAYFETFFQMQFPPEPPEPKMKPEGLWKRGLRSEQFKLILTYKGIPYERNKPAFGKKEDEIKTSELFRTELYDIINDPEEENNLAEKRKDHLEEMKEQLNKLIVQNEYQTQTSPGVTLSEEERQKLRSLGYIE